MLVIVMIGSGGDVDVVGDEWVMRPVPATLTKVGGEGGYS